MARSPASPSPTYNPRVLRSLTLVLFIAACGDETTPAGEPQIVAPGYLPEGTPLKPPPAPPPRKGAKRVEFDGTNRP